MPTMSAQFTSEEYGTYRKRLIVSDKLPLLEEKVELMKLLAKMPKKGIASNVFTWQKDQIRPKQDTATAARTSGDTTGFVFSGGHFAEGDLVWNLTTNERIRINTLTGVNTYSVSRQQGTTAAAAVTNGDVFLQIIRVKGQGATLGAARMTKPEEEHNYTQINREHFDITGTANAISEKGGLNGVKERARQQAHLMALVAREANHSLYFGQAHADQTPTSPTFTNAAGEEDSYTKGFLTVIPTANKTSTAYTGLSMGDINDITRPWHRYKRGSKRFTMVSYDIKNILSELALSFQRIAPGDNELGVEITTFNLGHGGQMTVIGDDTLEGGPNAAGAPKRTMLSICPTDCSIEELRPLQVLTDRRANGSADKVVDEVLWEWGLRYGDPVTHGYADNVSG